VDFVDDRAVEEARRLLEEFGQELTEDPDRLGQLLEGRVGGRKRESFLIVVGLREARLFPRSGRSDLAERLTDGLGLSPEAADWSARAALLLRSCPGEAPGQEPRFSVSPGNLPGEGLPPPPSRSAGRSRDPEVRKALAGGMALLLIGALLLAVGLKIRSDRRPEGGEFRIALLAPLSGPRAAGGQIFLKAAQLAVDQANAAGGIRGCRVRLVGFDVPSPGRAGAAATKALGSLHPSLLVHAGNDAEGEAIARVVEEAKVPLVEALAGSRAIVRGPEGQPRTFSFLLGPSYEGEGKLLAFFAVQGLRKVSAALLSDLDDPYSAELLRPFENFYHTFGGNVVARIGYRREGDLSAALTAIRESGADLLVLPVRGEDLSRIARQTREAGLSLPILAGRGGADASGKPDPSLEGAWWIVPAAPGDPGLIPFYDAFRQKYQEKCPRSAAASAVLVYDAVKWGEDALRRARGVEGEDLRRALSATANLPLLHATLTVDPVTRASKNKAAAVVRCEGGVDRFQKRFRP
jgi:branched-chain amino acid transport system substrate-binding protein